MTDYNSLSLEISRHVEQLSKQLVQDQVPFSIHLDGLDRVRSLGAAALLQDFEAASGDNVEDKIWNAHLKVNSKFREELRKLKDGGSAKVVGRRKLASEYLKFIKTAQKYYRGFIRSLNATYGGIGALQQVAGQLVRQDEDVRPRSRRQHTETVEPKLLRLCYKCLIQLGDLSRYRETELAEKESDWSHAVGYYDLARSIAPEFGFSYNQLAIVALADSNLFQATYYLYRALSTKEPHPQAEANLRRAFYKVSTTKNNGDSSQNGPALISWYLRLVSKCYHGKASAEHAELQNEVINHLERHLAQPSKDATLRKIFIINFAGCHFAQNRFTNDPNVDEHLLSYMKFLQLSLRCICVLLASVQQQFEQHAGSRASNGHRQIGEILPEALQNNLQLLRLAMMWSTKNITVLTNAVSPEVDPLQLKFWHTLARCLALAASSCDTTSLLDLDYMLEEDEDTIAFEPLVSGETRLIWYSENGRLRSKWHSLLNGARTSSQESSARLRYLLKAGMEFATDESTPLIYDFDQASFMYQPTSAAGDAMTAPVPMNQRHPQQTNMKSSIPLEEHTAQNEDDQDQDSGDQDAEAERMVAELVGNAGSFVPDPSNGSQPQHSADDPQTPPDASVPYSSDTKAASSFPAGSTTVQELLSAAQRCSPNAQRPTSSSRSRSSRHSGASTRPGNHDPSPRPSTLTRLVQSPVILSRRTSNHSRVHSSESVTSHASAWCATPNGSYRPNNANGAATPHNYKTPHGPLTPTLGPMGNGTFGTAASTDYGMNDTLLFGASKNSPWSMTGSESKRLSAGSPGLPPSPALRHDSGTGHGNGHASNLNAAAAPWRGFTRPGG